MFFPIATQWSVVATPWSVVSHSISNHRGVAIVTIATYSVLPEIHISTYPKSGNCYTSNDNGCCNRPYCHASIALQQMNTLLPRQIFGCQLQVASLLHHSTLQLLQVKLSITTTNVWLLEVVSLLPRQMSGCYKWKSLLPRATLGCYTWNLYCHAYCFIDTRFSPHCSLLQHILQHQLIMPIVHIAMLYLVVSNNNCTLNNI